MADDNDDMSSIAGSTATGPIAGNANWRKYVELMLPLERAADFTKEERPFVASVITVTGADTWNALPKDIQLNIVRGNAHEKERLKVTCESVKEIAAWRAKHHIDTEALAVGPFPGSERYFQNWPTRVAGLDAFGHPILYDRFSAMDLSKLVLLDEDSAFKYRTQALEALAYVKQEISARIGVRVTKHVYVLDLAGLDTSKHFTSAIQKRMKPVMKMSADMFPETLWTIWIINAPATFRFVWSIVRGWLDPIIRAKVRMWGPTRAKYLAAMAECGVSTESLPAEFGGTASSEGLDDILMRAAVAHSKSLAEKSDA